MTTARRMFSNDTYVNAAKPTTNYYGAPRLGLRKWDAANAQYAYISFPTPFPPGAKIVSATLKLTTYAMPETGTHTLNLSLVSEKTTYSRMTWNNRPDVSPVGQISESKPGALPGATVWTFDVKNMLQRISNGDLDWFGFRVTTADTQQRWLYAQETTLKGGDGPTLSVTYADEPDAPQSLTPDEGVVSTSKPALSFDYVDYGGDITLAQAQIQTSSTTSFAVPTWDSGVLDEVTKPVIYLSGTTYPGATPGQRVYYRVKVADGAGLWSRWSPVAWFVYKPPVTVTPTSFDPQNPAFSDSTPDISWSVTGGTQKAYRITIARNANPKLYLWDTGKVGSSNKVVQVPPKVLRWDDTNYRVIIRVWDQENRVAAANSLAYVSESYIVHLDEDDSMTPPDVPTLSQATHSGGKLPFVDISWDRPTSADAYEIVRQAGDDEAPEKVIIGRVDYAESLQPDGTHRFQDRSAPGNTRLRYIVRAVTNGKRSGGRPSAWWDGFPSEGVWLTTDEVSMSLVINGVDQGTFELPEAATAHYVLNSQAPVIVRELHRGYEGQVQGILVEEDKYQPYLTRQQKRDRFLWFKKRLHDNCRLIAGDLNIPVQIGNCNVHPTPDAIPLQYAVSFNFWQIGEVWWDVESRD